LDTISLIKNHRSIRHFTTEPIPDSVLETLIDSGKAASSSSFVQCTSIIRITDPSIRKNLMEIAKNQSHIEKAPEFLVFCIDFNRHCSIVPEAQMGFTEQLITGCVDVALFAQTLTLAAEALGYGTVYIGALRNDPLKVIEILNLPQHVFPLFGLCLGRPEQTPPVKPRLPNTLLLHENTYMPLSHPEKRDALNAYDQTLLQYLQSRTDNPRLETWSQSLAFKLTKEARPFMKEALQKQGFLKS
jgi:nitroreductase